MSCLPFPIIIFVYREFFQIHGSKFKPDPISHCCQASVRSITHSMLFFCVGKYSFYLFFSQPVQFRVFRCMTEILGKFHIVVPNVFRHRLDKILRRSTKMSGRTMLTHFRIAFVFSVSLEYVKILYSGQMIQS